MPQPAEKNTSTEIQRKRGIYLLPNLFTTAGLFAGFYAVIAGMQNHFRLAAIAIFIAMIMDLFDGRIARLTNTQTLFGAEYDSLSDMVAFGVAPALLMYSWALQSLGKLGWLAAFIYTASTALRLARFNVRLNTGDKRYFQGLPSPCAAGLIASLIWFCREFGIWVNAPIAVGMAVVTITVGLLMVSAIPYRSFKELNLHGKVPFVSILIVVLLFVCISLDPPQILFYGFLSFVLSGPIFFVIRIWHKRRCMRKVLSSAQGKGNEKK